ncbi:MAG: small acid-soluble spore protein SspI [Caldibacillus sp.]
MNFNLRQAVIQNISENTRDQLKDTIVDAIQSGEEKMLPGLGVLFEIIWNQASDDERQKMLDNLVAGLQK